MRGDVPKCYGDADDEKTYYVYKTVRRNKSNPSEMQSFYGIIFDIKFDARGSDRTGYSWSFRLDPLSNCRPNDRNLEWFGRQEESWKKNNLDRINNEPEPEALRFAPDGD